MIKDKIKKSLLFIISPPFFWEDWQTTQLLNIPISITANKYLLYNKYVNIC